MTIAEARIPTVRASRYLDQLCRHLSQMAQTRHQPPIRHGGGDKPPKIEHIDYSDTYGTIRFAQGLCTLRATSDELMLRLEADDEDTLQRLQNGIAGRIEKIGRRDGLAVTWTRPQVTQASDDPPGQEGTAGPGAASGTRARRRRGIGQMIGLGGAGILVLAVHLGLFGTTLAGSAWVGWGINAVIGLVVLKVLFVAAHVALGRFGIRRGKAFMAHRRRRLAPGPAAPRGAAASATAGITAAGITTDKRQP